MSPRQHRLLLCLEQHAETLNTSVRLTCDTVLPMADVTVRDLRNHGGDVLDRVVHGESVTITRGGRPVAELRPLVPPGLTTRAVIERWSRLPAMDPTRLREDLESVLDARV